MASNGRIPLSSLRRVQHVTGGAHYLRTDASKALDRIALIAISRGWGTYLTDSYRSYATQVRLRSQWCAKGKCHYAAVPGTSNHGWGVAVDAADSRTDGLARFLHKFPGIAEDHGWFWPAWASKSPYEPWHFEYSSSLDRYRGKPINDPGELSMADIKELKALIKSQGAATRKTVKTQSDLTRKRINAAIDRIEAEGTQTQKKTLAALKDLDAVIDAGFAGVEAAIPGNLDDELDELRRNLRDTALQSGVPEWDIEGDADADAAAPGDGGDAAQAGLDRGDVDPPATEPGGAWSNR